KDRLLEIAQRASRLDSHLVDENLVCAAVGLEGVALSSGTVQRQHQLAPEALAVRVRGDELLQLGDHPVVAADGEVGVYPFLYGLQPQLVERGDRTLRERLVGEVGERRSAPQAQRLGEDRRTRGSGRRAGLVEQPLETVGVDGVGLYGQPVTGPGR